MKKTLSVLAVLGIAAVIGTHSANAFEWSSLNPAYWGHCPKCEKQKADCSCAKKADPCKKAKCDPCKKEKKCDTCQKTVDPCPCTTGAAAPCDPCAKKAVPCNPCAKSPCSVPEKQPCEPCQKLQEMAK